MRDYIHIEKEMIPYSFNILLADEWFALSIDYNETADMFTLALYKDNELIATEPLILDVPLFADVYRKGFPAVTLVPQDPSGTVDEITYSNLGENVYLTIDDEGDDDD